MKVAVAQGLLNSHSYVKYRDIVSGLLSQGKVSGHEQSEALLHYTQLNEARMNRLDKKMVVTEDNIQKLLNLKKALHLVGIGRRLVWRCRAVVADYQ